ncbi:MAG: helix-turn-helix domain-containing protein [Spirochaetales bacterium]|nr:helix-turn-helix domain-containing protein [Spirochaetales bacterium]
MKYYSVKEAADILKIHPKTLGRYIRDKEIQAGKIGKSWRIAETELKAYMDRTLGLIKGGENPTGADIAPVIDEPRIRVTSVIDIHVHSLDEANRISNSITALLNSKDPSLGMSRFHSAYDPSLSQLKMVLWGSPKLVGDLLLLLDRFED